MEARVVVLSGVSTDPGSDGVTESCVCQSEWRLPSCVHVSRFTGLCSQDFCLLLFVLDPWGLVFRFLCLFQADFHWSCSLEYRPWCHMYTRKSKWFLKS